MDENVRPRPLWVAGFVATTRGEESRGPLVRMHPEDARARLLTDGELAWVHGARRPQLAEVAFDETLRKGEIVLRDVAGVSPSESVRVMKPDLDNAPKTGLA